MEHEHIKTSKGLVSYNYGAQVWPALQLHVHHSSHPLQS